MPDGDKLYGALCVVPMGWSWAMWIAQRVHQHQAMLACGLSTDRIIFDGRPPRPLAAGAPALLPDADNLNVVGTDQARVQETTDVIVKHFRNLGFRVHEELDATSYATS